MNEQYEHDAKACARAVQAIMELSQISEKELSEEMLTNLVVEIWAETMKVAFAAARLTK